ncbi:MULTISPECIES: hypothetical protein [Aeromonas]|uniref:Uncharacterized protein n=1 Tax=Aeromonas caviae TaxID=648 RepID=A0AAF0JZ62_AERCA|nr:hypothetical protein [Aeromonas caviae]MBL0558303.1 hypothetical protein [Aeromonas caviae]MBL0582819.1 hypothetical protein [Aeromonas caviae]MDX7676181.1 hypothetical protein [Aeromonas caviae]MDY7841429.1 hypothetical protein [Aeromonas caviae]WGC86124.1 hypothetical protein OJY61_22820 [Aeromonas caviae]
MSASLTAQLTALAQRFRLGLSLEAIQTLPALLEQTASESLSWPAQQQQLLPVLIKRILEQQEREDWLALADELEYELVTLFEMTDKG